MSKHPNPLIHKESFKVAHPARFLALLMGVASLANGFIMLNSELVDTASWVSNVSFILFGLGIIVFFFFPKRKRQLRVFQDHLEIFAKGKEIQSYNLADTGRHRSDRKWFYLGPEKGSSAIMVPKGEHAKVQGLIEILLAHQDLPEDLWNTFKLDNEEGYHAHIHPEHRRIFLHESGKAFFLDQGIRVSTENHQFFFPRTSTAPVVHPRPQGSVSGYMQQGQYNPIPKFDPDPARLPLQSLLIALLEAQLPAAELVSTLQLLTDSYIGTELTKNETEDLFEGNTLGYTVQVQSIA